MEAGEAAEPPIVHSHPPTTAKNCLTPNGSYITYTPARLTSEADEPLLLKKETYECGISGVRPSLFQNVLVWVKAHPGNQNFYLYLGYLLGASQNLGAGIRRQDCLSNFGGCLGA